VTPAAAPGDPQGVVVGVDCTTAAPPATVTAFAPGRVNLIGEHTDYSGGLALPMAIHLGTTVTARRTTGAIALVSDADDLPVDLPGPHPAAEARSDTALGWGRFVAGVAREVAAGAGTCGVAGSVTTTLPVGAGLSSSAALEVATALAIGFSGTARDLAEACQRAEQWATGVPCGLLDQLASACGVEDHALCIDFSARTVTPVAMPADLEVVVVHSGESRTLAGSAYAERRRQCEEAARLVGPLASAQPGDVEGIGDGLLRRRARHVVGENARVRAMVEALSRGDSAGAGELLVASHRSLADDFGVSTPALDQLVDDLVATDGVFGARLTGAGFGGCAVALTRPGVFAEAPGVWPVRPGPGARVALTRMG